MVRYFYSTELVTFLFCIIIFSFVLYNRPQKTHSCIICLNGVFTLFLEMLFEGGLYLYSRYDNAPTIFVINLFFVAHFIAHISLLINLSLYIDGLSIHHYLTANLTKVISSFIVLICCVFFTYFLATDQLYIYSDHNIWIAPYTVFLNIISVSGTLIVFTFVIAHKREFPRGLIHMVIYSIPTMLFLQILQIIKNGQLFHGIIYIMPLMILYFFYHNNPYDQKTGYQDLASFEAMFQACLNSNKKFHIVYIEVPKFNDPSYVSRAYTQEQQSDILIDACRQLEYASKETRLYRLTQSSFAILFFHTKAEKDTVLLKTIQQIVFDSSSKGGPDIYFHAVHFPHTDNVNSFLIGKKLVHYILEKHATEPVNTWIEPTLNDYATYLKLIEVEQILTDISEKKNPDDPRILCYAQPIYDVHTRSFHSAEALVRMQNDGNMIYPDQFIPLAEKMGCIHVLTCIMLNKICKMIPTLKTYPNFEAVTINCSATELCDQNLYQDITSIIHQHHVEPSNIRIELTESAMIENYDAMIFNIKRLSEFGIKFYLDDFGTGFSNFERIMTCPLNTIKFDKSLLYKAYMNPSIDNMLTNLIFIFKQSDLHVLMEGVENAEQSEFCAERGIDFIQGYHYAKPIPIEEIVHYFSENPLR